MQSLSDLPTAKKLRLSVALAVGFGTLCLILCICIRWRRSSWGLSKVTTRETIAGTERESAQSYQSLLKAAESRPAPSSDQVSALKQLIHAGRATSAFLTFAILSLLPALALALAVWPLDRYHKYHFLGKYFFAAAWGFLLLAVIIWSAAGHGAINGGIQREMDIPKASLSWCFNACLACLVLIPFAAIGSYLAVKLQGEAEAYTDITRGGVSYGTSSESYEGGDEATGAEPGTTGPANQTV